MIVTQSIALKNYNFFRCLCKFCYQGLVLFIFMDWYVTYSEDIGNKPKSSNYYKGTADNFTNVNYDDTDSDDFSFQRRKDAISYLGKDGIFSEKIPDFKVREGQLTMADAWQKCVNNESESVLVCEAGTGTGKLLRTLFLQSCQGRLLLFLQHQKHCKIS